MLSIKDKVFKFNVPFDVKDMHDDDDDGNIRITGLASTIDRDRHGDIIVSDAWKKAGALENYLKNPVVLAFHDMNRPIGKTIDHEVTSNGLKITAKISKTAKDIIELIKEGILTAFSVGFMIKDADYDHETGIFLITDVELFEVSVVSVPANQNALFSVEKNFSTINEYNEFRKQFIKKESEETSIMVDKTKGEGGQANPVDMTSLVKEITASIKKDLESEQKAKEEAEKKAKEEAERISGLATTAAERLIKDLREELVNKDKEFSETVEGLRTLLKEKKDEIQDVYNAENKGKMKYVQSDDERWKGLSEDQKHGMIYAARIKGIRVEETKTFRDFVAKSGMEHWDAGVTGEWEDEYSTTVQNALRENLVVEPIFTTIPMSTPTLNMPINPEAGNADWVHSAAYRSSQNPADETGTGSGAGAVSSGEAIDHQLDEQTIIAYKLATREYVGYEEEEDSIVALAPIIRDAVARRMARESDRAILRGGGVLTNTAAYDPITGLEIRGANTTDVSVAGGAAWGGNFTEDDVVDMRRNLGIYGLDPDMLVLLASHDLYYELMKLTNFKTVDVLGNRATILTGEVGQLFGIRVLVSQQFDNAAITAGTVGTTLGILCRPQNFVVGNLRGVMTEGDKDVINQKRVIVSSRRFGFQDIITGQGTVNLEIAS